MLSGHRQTLSGCLAGLLALCTPRVAVAQTDCDEVEVNGGVYSGVYSLHDDDFGTDGDVYHTETDDGTYAFLFYVDWSRRRLNDARQDLEESVHETDEAQHKHFPLGRFGFPPAALEDARVHAGETLAACYDGFWSIWEYSHDDIADPGFLYYPYFQAPDCADHPADITADWYEFDCTDCVSSTIVSIAISCHDSSGEEDDGSVTTTGEDDDGSVTTTGEEDDGSVTTTGEDDDGGVTTTGEDDDGSVTTTGEDDDGGVTTTGEDDDGGVTTTGEDDDGSVTTTGEDVDHT